MNNWMKNIPDEFLISEINLVGTHDSATQFIRFRHLSRCQNKNIFDQLTMGIRFLDIRLKFDGEKLNFFEQLSLKILITNHYTTKINLFFGVQAKDDKEEKLAIEEYNPQNNLSDEIKKLLEEINTLSSKLPEEVKNSLNQKISKLTSKEYADNIFTVNGLKILKNEKIETDVKEKVSILSRIRGKI